MFPFFFVLRFVLGTGKSHIKISLDLLAHHSIYHSSVQRLLILHVDHLFVFLTTLVSTCLATRWLNATGAN